MRPFAAATLCLALLPIAGVFAADPPPAPGPVDTSAMPPAAPAHPDAAAKHAKRTACRKEASDQKLTGKDKKDYVKTCISK